MCYVIVGISSYIYHASLTRFGYFADHGNIAMTINFATLYAVANLLFLDDLDGSPWADDIPLIAWMIACMLSYIEHWYTVDNENYRKYSNIFIQLPIAITAMVLKDSEKNHRYLTYGGVFGAIGFSMFEHEPIFPDWTWCWPRSLL